MKRNKGFRWAEVMRHLQGNPRTIKEIAKYMQVHYDTARKYLTELLLQEKIEPHNEGKPIRYRRRK